MKSHLVQPEPPELVIDNAACERLRRLSQQIRRGAAKNQEASRQRAPIREYAQEREKVRAALDLVDHDQPRQWLQNEAGVVHQPVQIRGIFQIQPMRGAGVTSGDLSRQRRLPDLPRSENRNDRKRAKSIQNGADVDGTRNHDQTLP